MEPKPQGCYVPNNGVGNESAKKGNFDGIQGNKQEVGEGEYKDSSSEDLAADLSSQVKGERSENHGSSGDQDPLLESIFALQSAQKVLEKELLMFKDISKDISADESVSATHTEFSAQRQSEVDEETKRYVETEREDLFKQKIETDVEFVVISRAVQKLKISSRNQITDFLEEQKALVSDQKQMLHKLTNAENKAVMLLKEAHMLESVCEGIAVADETLKLQKTVFKYSLCFLLQILLLVAIVTVFLYRISHTYLQPAPT